ILAIKFKPPFSETCRCIGDNYIHYEIYEIIETNNFWDQIKDLVKILTSYCKMSQFRATATNISYSTFGNWLNYYYRAWAGQEPKCILREFNNFHLKNSPFNDKTYQQFEDEDALSYWCYVKNATNELGLVAYRIFDICVNAASVERLWSCMDFIQTKRRNRLT
ncbi:304_t:CDS:2, partial [Cetraspora pellucida]